MGFMNNVKTDDKTVEGDDRVGGGFEPLPSDIYDVTIKMAYGGQSAAGASCVTLICDVGGKELRETIYFTNRDGQNFFVDKQDKTTKRELPGFTLLNDICLFTTEKGLLDGQVTEDKVAKVYDPTERKEINKTVEALTGLMGKNVKLAVLREIVVKQKKGDDGKYHDTNETRMQNSIDKALHPETGRTVIEYKQGIEDTVYMTTWLERNKGQDRNKAKHITNGGGGNGSTGMGRPGGAPAGDGAPKAKTSLFG